MSIAHYKPTALPMILIRDEKSLTFSSPLFLSLSPPSSLNPLPPPSPSFSPSSSLLLLPVLYQPSLFGKVSSFHHLILFRQSHLGEWLCLAESLEEITHRIAIGISEQKREGRGEEERERGEGEGEGEGGGRRGEG